MPIPAALALFTVLIGAGCGGDGSDPGAQAAPAVTVSPVAERRLADERERVGQIRAIQEVTLRARVSGFLEERRFTEGADVAQGDVLFVIEQAPYQAKLLQAEAELARAKSELQELELELRRTRTLHERQVTSDAALDAATTAAGAAAADVLAAEARLKQAQLDLDYTTIRAPMASRVGQSAYDVGDFVGPESGSLATLLSLDPIHVYWEVPEQTLLDFRRASAARRRDGDEPIRVTARLRFGDGSLYEGAGSWDFVDNRVDANTGTQTARAVFPNPEKILIPGQYATVLVQVGEPRKALVVPQAAVQEDQGGRFVLVVGRDGIAQVRRVTMGARDGIYWEVSQGLAAGELVVYQGIQKVRPGAPVSPKQVEPEAGLGGTS